jgi:hypothetical protein
MTLANPAQEAQAGRGALHVERVVILNDANRLPEIVAGGRDLNTFPCISDSKRVYGRFGLGRILTAAEVERERTHRIRMTSQLRARVTRHQQHRRAVHPSGKRHAHGLICRYPRQPLSNHVVGCADIFRARLADVSRALCDRRTEEPVITRRGIGTADLIELDDVMRRHHARIDRIELPADPL